MVHKIQQASRIEKKEETVHLIIEGCGGSTDELSSLGFVAGFLERYPDQIGMAMTMPPYVFKYRGNDPRGLGVSGFVLIAESHVSVHTFPERGHVSIDVFSTKGFDHDMAAQLAKRMLGLHFVRYRTVAVWRDDYPHDIKFQELFRSMEKERDAMAQVVASS